MNRLFRITIWLVVGVSTLMAQRGGSFGAGLGAPYFESKVFPTFTEDEGVHIARVYVQFANDYLTFIKTDSNFMASVQIEVFITDSERDFLFNRTLNKDVFVDEYQETNAPNVLNTVYTDIEIEPGEYVVSLALMDKNSNRQLTTKDKFSSTTVQAAEKDRFLMSDILFLHDVTQDSAGNILSFSPLLSNSFSGDAPYLYAYFNTFVHDPDDSLMVEYMVRDEFGNLVKRNQYISDQQSSFMEHFVRLNRYNFDRNLYTFELASSNGHQRVTAAQQFAFYWKDTPHSLEELEQAIRQLEYIGERDSINHYVDNAAYEAKRAFFLRFWSERDPNPGTIENELQIEYYRRIQVAEQNFSVTGNNGWRTDRGRIFVKFGEPDDYERHPFEAESYPYEIWRYYDLRKTFLFIDRTGFGDYVLHPNYYFVEFE